MTSELDSIQDKIQYCVDIIVKETPQEERLVKQILYAMLSAYSNRPINLAINAPSGEGKNYILNKVAEKFPENDVVFLAGMTDKALFHGNGKAVIKNDNGEYDPLEERLSEINERIKDKESEILESNSKDLKQGLKSQIEQLENDKKDLINEAKKLIDLSHKILIFLDTPRLELFAGIMPLLSHDKEQVEYQYTDSNNGIRTKGNILRGFPAVIFAQAIDTSYYERFPEIKRRFIFVNPKMDKVKYDAAINLMADKFGLPDFAYQAKIVSSEQKDNAKSIIRDIAGYMIEHSERTEHDKNDVIIPFIDAVNKSLDRDKTFDMTTAKRLMTYLGILPIINYENRPRLIYEDLDNILHVEVSPIATFEDLKEAMYLMEYGDGVRPFIMDWFNEVYTPTYEKLKEPNSRVDSNGKILRERRIGLSANQLSNATTEIQDKVLSEKQIRDHYLKALFNENIIDLCDSECDRRSKISYPLISKNKISIYTYGTKDIFNSTHMKINVVDSTIYPSKEYLKSWIWAILKMSENTPSKIKIISHKKIPLTADELIEQYHPNPEDYFTEPTTKRNPSYNLMLVYRGSQLLHLLPPKTTYDYEDYKRDFSF